MGKQPFRSRSPVFKHSDLLYTPKPSAFVLLTDETVLDVVRLLSIVLAVPSGVAR